MALKKSSKTFTITDESENSYGLVVKTDGGNIQEFIKNPVGLLNHNYDKVICLWEDLKTIQDIMAAIPAFDENDPEAMLIYQKVEDGIIKGCSIGITALAWDGNMITEWLLKEISITPLPANKNAVVLYDNQGIKLNDDQAKQFLLSLKPTTPNTDINTDKKMNEKQKKALIALALQMGLTLMLSDSEERYEDVLDKATSKIKDLQDQLKSQGDNQAIALVDQAITDLKITADDKDFYLAAAKADYVGAAKMIGKMQAVNLNINNTLEPGNGADAGKGADAADPRKDWSYTDWSKKDSAGLQQMRFSDVPKFKALYKADFGEEYEG